MIDELYFYDIYPKIVRKGMETLITIRTLSSHVAFEEGGDYIIRIYPITADIYSDSRPPVAEYPVKVLHGAIRFSHTFIGEQEHFVRIFRKGEDRFTVQLSVYSLEEDLFCTHPYRGDFHVHTYFSDGREAPEFVAAMYRQAGFDFISITDHGQRTPALNAIDAYKDVDIDFQIYPGEEIHPVKNHVHILNFGGDFSVNDLCRTVDGQNNISPVPEWTQRVEAAAKELGELPEGVDPFVHACCLEVIKQIKKANGMSIFCHPYWIPDVYHVTPGFTKFYLENGFADAFELLNGHTMRENNLQTAFWHDMCANGANIPIVGSSDSHGTVNRNLFNEQKTIVLARGNTRNDIIEAVKGGYSVPIEEYKGEDPHFYGNFRMVSYGIFLNRNYFPLHDELCYEEGRLMRAYIAGDETARSRLAALKGQTAKLIEKYFAAYQ